MNSASANNVDPAANVKAWEPHPLLIGAVGAALLFMVGVFVFQDGKEAALSGLCPEGIPVATTRLTYGAVDQASFDFLERARVRYAGGQDRDSRWFSELAARGLIVKLPAGTPGCAHGGTVNFGGRDLLFRAGDIKQLN